MGCTHDINDREIAVMADGMCPLCMQKRIEDQHKKIEELEAKLKKHDKSNHEMVNKKYLEQLHERIEVLETEKAIYILHMKWLVGNDKEKMKELVNKLKSERQKYSMSNTECNDIFIECI